MVFVESGNLSQFVPYLINMSLHYGTKKKGMSNFLRFFPREITISYENIFRSLSFVTISGQASLRAILKMIRGRELCGERNNRK